MTPIVGDRWEIAGSGRYPVIKEIGRIYLRFTGWGSPREMYVAWKRKPKGGYTGMSLSMLKQSGKFIDSAQQRQAKASAPNL